MFKHAIFDKKNVLVLGGAGFIGSHLCDRLAQTAKVICVDNFSDGSEYNIDHLLADPNFKFIKADFAEPLILENQPELADFKVEFQGVQEIYNLACPTAPLNFHKNKVANLLANSYVVKNALDLAQKYQAKLLHFSSSVVYGARRSSERVSEEFVGALDPMAERASYDTGKCFAEAMVRSYRDVYNLDAKIIRLSRIYGPRMPLNQGHLLPDFIVNALDNRDLVIFGNETFATSFCYIDDCLAAIDKMMNSDLAGPINIGSDFDINLTEVAKQVIALTGSQSKIVYTDEHLFITSLPLLDITKAREQLGWIPLVSLEHGLTKTIDDLRASKNLKHAV